MALLANVALLVMSCIMPKLLKARNVVFEFKNSKLEYCEVVQILSAILAKRSVFETRVFATISDYFTSIYCSLFGFSRFPKYSICYAVPNTIFKETER